MSVSLPPDSEAYGIQDWTGASIVVGRSDRADVMRFIKRAEAVSDGAVDIWPEGENGLIFTYQDNLFLAVFDNAGVLRKLDLGVTK